MFGLNYEENHFYVELGIIRNRWLSNYAHSNTCSNITGIYANTNFADNYTKTDDSIYGNDRTANINTGSSNEDKTADSDFYAATHSDAVHRS